MYTPSTCILGVYVVLYTPSLSTFSNSFYFAQIFMATNSCLSGLRGPPGVGRTGSAHGLDRWGWSIHTVSLSLDLVHERRLGVLLEIVERPRAS